MSADSAPNEAIKTGCIDQVLALNDIPRAIERPLRRVAVGCQFAAA